MKSAILFSLLLLFVSSLVAGQDIAEFTANAQKLQDLNTLEFGDTCSSANEDKRSAFGIKLLDAIKSGSISALTSLNGDMKGLLNGGRFCNSLKNLQCQSNNKCGCANGLQAGYNVQSVRENNACRLKRGSLCVPDESLSSFGSQKPDLKCQQGATCTFRADRSGCTNAKIIAEVQKSFPRFARPSMNQVMTKLQEELQNGICQCG